MKYLIPANIFLGLLTFVLIIASVIFSPLASATNKHKPQPIKSMQQGQLQGQAQLSVNKNKNVNKNFNVNTAIADVKNNLKLTNKLYGGDNYIGDTVSSSGGNYMEMNAMAPVNFVNPSVDSCTGALTYTNDGGPYDAGKGAGVGCNWGFGPTKALKEAKASLFKAQASILERNAARDDALATMELARDQREADKDEVKIRVGCSKLHYAGHVSKDTICESVEFTDVHHTPEVSKAGLMRDPGHKD